MSSLKQGKNEIILTSLQSRDKYRERKLANVITGYWYSIQNLDSSVDWLTFAENQRIAVGEAKCPWLDQ